MHKELSDWYMEIITFKTKCKNVVLPFDEHMTVCEYGLSGLSEKNI